MRCLLSAVMFRLMKKKKNAGTLNELKKEKKKEKNERKVACVVR